jgi:hypothetical protein
VAGVVLGLAFCHSGCVCFVKEVEIVEVVVLLVQVLKVHVLGPVRNMLVEGRVLVAERAVSALFARGGRCAGVVAVGVRVERFLLDRSVRSSLQRNVVEVAQLLVDAWVTTETAAVLLPFGILHHLTLVLSAPLFELTEVLRANRQGAFIVVLVSARQVRATALVTIARANLLLVVFVGAFFSTVQRLHLNLVSSDPGTIVAAYTRA